MSDEPPFTVGDRVRVRGDLRDGTVTAVTSYDVEVQLDGDDSLASWKFKNVRRLEPAQRTAEGQLHCRCGREYPCDKHEAEPQQRPASAPTENYYEHNGRAGLYVPIATVAPFKRGTRVRMKHARARDVRNDDSLTGVVVGVSLDGKTVHVLDSEGDTTPWDPGSLTLDSASASPAVGELTACIRAQQRGEPPYHCKVPPPGWSCSRGEGHHGPCAATRGPVANWQSPVASGSAGSSPAGSSSPAPVSSNPQPDVDVMLRGMLRVALGGEQSVAEVDGHEVVMRRTDHPCESRTGSAPHSEATCQCCIVASAMNEACVRYEKALEFYGNVAHYVRGPGPSDESDVEEDSGATARTALDASPDATPCAGPDQTSDGNGATLSGGAKTGLGHPIAVTCDTAPASAFGDAGILSPKLAERGRDITPDSVVTAETGPNASATDQCPWCRGVLKCSSCDQTPSADAAGPSSSPDRGSK